MRQFAVEFIRKFWRFMPRRLKVWAFFNDGV